MARSNKTIEQKYNTPFAANIRKLMDERAVTQDVLAKAIGKTRQTVSQYANGISEPSYEALIKIANFFCVSTDFLLGISPYQTTDKNQEFICKYTGLGEKSVKLLHNLNTVHEKYPPTNGEVSIEATYAKSRISALNTVLESNECTDILMLLYIFLNMDFTDEKRVYELPTIYCGDAEFDLSSEDIGWGLLRRFENNLYKMRDTTKNKITANYLL